MADGEDRCIEVDGQTALLGVDERLAWGKAQLGTKLCGAELAAMHGIDRSQCCT